MEVEYGFSNAGKWVYVSPRRSAFINNPSMSRICAWTGDIPGGDQVKCVPVPGMDPPAIGYQCSAYVMVPNPLQGSAESPGEIYVMSDVYNAGKLRDDRGPCSLLLWRLAFGR